MADGWYWINDKHRYGWEVVQVINGEFFRAGIRGGEPIKTLDCYESVRLEKPPQE